jgi:alcohol dehydrogenase
MPTKVFFGSGCVSENGAELKALGSRAMIVTGKHSSRINGSLAAVEQALQANGQTYVIFDEIEENPSVETVRTSRMNTGLWILRFLVRKRGKL